MDPSPLQDMMPIEEMVSGLTFEALARGDQCSGMIVVASQSPTILTLHGIAMLHFTPDFIVYVKSSSMG